MTKEGQKGFIAPDVRGAEAGTLRAEEELKAAIEAERPEDLAPPVEEDGGEDKKDKEVVPKDVPGDEKTTEHDWEGRYGNLRRFVQKKMDEHKAVLDQRDAEIVRLTQENEQAARKNAPDLPETDEDLDTLKKEHPETYNAILRIANGVAQTIVDDRMKDLEDDVNLINARNRKSVEDAAMVALQKLHPRVDIASLNSDEVFGEWLGSKPKAFQNLLTGQREDVEAASTVLQAYEREVLDKDPRSKTQQVLDDAAKAAKNVSSTTPVDADITPVDKGYDFTESEIERMSSDVYEKNESAIDKAYRSGRVLLDRSGARSA